jgi:hypothetical protein
MLNLYPVSLSRKEFGVAVLRYGEAGKHVLAWRHCSYKWHKVRERLSDSVERNKYWGGLRENRNVRLLQIWGLHAASALWFAGSMVVVTVRFLPGALAPVLTFKNRRDSTVIDV